MSGRYPKTPYSIITKFLLTIISNHTDKSDLLSLMFQPRVKSSETSLTSAQKCSGDIANIDGKLLCNPPLGLFTPTCSMVDVNNDVLTAQCLRRDGTGNSASLDLAGYSGVVSNCDGHLLKGRCH